MKEENMIWFDYFSNNDILFYNYLIARVKMFWCSIKKATHFFCGEMYLPLSWLHTYMRFIV